MNDYKQDIYKFINNYFQEIDNIAEFHLSFFIKNKIQTIDIDMLVLEKYIFQAFNFIRTNIGIYFSKFLNKLYKDIESLTFYLKNFLKETKIINNIFENEFLKKLPEYTILKTKIEENTKLLHTTSSKIASLETQIKFFQPKNKEDEKELKILRGKLVDAIHYNAKAKEEISQATIELNKLKSTLREIFIEEFSKIKTTYISKFKLVLNTKLYYFNKQLWKEVNQNQKAKTYFNDLGIKNINLKTFINNQLKHIDISRSKNFEEYSKIEEVLKKIDG